MTEEEFDDDINGDVEPTEEPEEEVPNQVEPLDLPSDDPDDGAGDKQVPDMQEPDDQAVAGQEGIGDQQPMPPVDEEARAKAQEAKRSTLEFYRKKNEARGRRIPEEGERLAFHRDVRKKKTEDRSQAAKERDNQEEQKDVQPQPVPEIEDGGMGGEGDAGEAPEEQPSKIFPGPSGELHDAAGVEKQKTVFVPAHDPRSSVGSAAIFDTGTDGEFSYQSNATDYEFGQSMADHGTGVESALVGMTEMFARMTANIKKINDHLSALMDKVEFEDHRDEF